MTYLVSIAELLSGTDAGGRKRRRDRRPCERTLHCSGGITGYRKEKLGYHGQDREEESGRSAVGRGTEEEEELAVVDGDRVEKKVSGG